MIVISFTGLQRHRSAEWSLSRPSTRVIKAKFGRERSQTAQQCLSRTALGVLVTVNLADNVEVAAELAVT
ncbi:MAG: hypothetical protein IJ636_08475, partial [Bacteroidales bacterium]|nr:hypothetical protein [Bacteroidales bacterium]